MTRGWKLAAAVWLAVFMIIGSAHADASVKPGGPMGQACRIGYETPTLAKRTMWCWAHRFAPTRVRYVARKAVCISRWESGWQYDADNGTHAGFFQWSKAYWPSTMNQFPVIDRNTSDNIKNGRTNAAFAIAWQARRGYQPWAGNRCVD